MTRLKLNVEWQHPWMETFSFAKVTEKISFKIENNTNKNVYLGLCYTRHIFEGIAVSYP